MLNFRSSDNMMDFCKTGQCLQKVILSLVQTICFLSLLDVVLISGHHIHLSWVEHLCLFPWGGFSVRWGRNHNKPTHQHSTGSLACDTNWKVRLQIAILQPLTQKPWEIHQELHRLLYCVPCSSLLNVEKRTLYVHLQCASTRWNKFYTLFPAINN